MAERRQFLIWPVLFSLPLSCNAVTWLINWIPYLPLCKSFLLPISRAVWDLCYVFTHLAGILLSLPLLLILCSVKSIRGALAAPRAYIIHRLSCILLRSTLCVTQLFILICTWLNFRCCKYGNFRFPVWKWFQGGSDDKNMLWFILVYITSIELEEKKWFWLEQFLKNWKAESSFLLCV